MQFPAPRFSLLQLMLLATWCGLALALYLSSQAAQDYWRDKWYFEPRSVDFSPNGKWLVMSFFDGRVELREITPAGLLPRRCDARWAAWYGLGYPRFVANDRIAYYEPQKLPLGERLAYPGEPKLAFWNVESNQRVAATFPAPPRGQELAKYYQEQGGTGALKWLSSFVLHPTQVGAPHRHLRDPANHWVELWEVSPDGKHLVLVGIDQSRTAFGSPGQPRNLFVMDAASGVVLQEFEVANTSLPNPWLVVGSQNQIALMERASSHKLVVRIRSLLDFSVQQELDCLEVKKGRRYSALRHVRLSADGQRLLIDDFEHAQVWHVPTGQRVMEFEGSAALLHNSPRAFGQISGWARYASPPRFALSPDGKRLAAIDQMHVDLWDVDTDRHVGRAWTAWSAAGATRRHITAFLAFAVVAGLILRWQHRQAASADAIPAAIRYGRWLAMPLLVIGGAISIVGVVPPLLAETDPLAQMPFIAYARFAALASSVFAIAIALGGRRWQMLAALLLGINVAAHQFPAALLGGAALLILVVAWSIDLLVRTGSPLSSKLTDPEAVR